MSVQTSLDTAKKDTSKIKKSLRWHRDKDREMVRGMFKFYEVPGGQMSFVYRAYKEDKTERYDLVDGQIYSLPLGVARHLNKNGWYPVHSYTTNEQGIPSQKIGEKKRRFGFQSLEFVDIDDLSEDRGSGIVTVENI